MKRTLTHLGVLPPALGQRPGRRGRDGRADADAAPAPRRRRAGRRAGPGTAPTGRRRRGKTKTLRASAKLKSAKTLRVNRKRAVSRPGELQR